MTKQLEGLGLRCGTTHRTVMVAGMAPPTAPSCAIFTRLKHRHQVSWVKGLWCSDLSCWCSPRSVLPPLFREHCQELDSFPSAIGTGPMAEVYMVEFEWRDVSCLQHGPEEPPSSNSPPGAGRGGRALGSWRRVQP